MNEVSGRKRSSCSKIRAASPEERIRLWKKHFENLLGQPQVVDEQLITKVFDILSIETGVFTNLELQKAIKTTKNNTATGLDNIPGEIRKLNCLNKQLLQICNKAYKDDIPHFLYG